MPPSGGGARADTNGLPVASPTRTNVQQGPRRRMPPIYTLPNGWEKQMSASIADAFDEK
jgi:hypothetical protein